MTQDRAQGLVYVFLFVLTSLLALWVLFVVGTAVIEPIFGVAQDIGAVESEGYDGTVDRLLSIFFVWTPLTIGVGVLLLTIIYAVFQEQFRNSTPRP